MHSQSNVLEVWDTWVNLVQPQCETGQTSIEPSKLIFERSISADFAFGSQDEHFEPFPVMRFSPHSHHSTEFHAILLFPSQGGCVLQCLSECFDRVLYQLSKVWLLGDHF